MRLRDVFEGLTVPQVQPDSWEGKARALGRKYPKLTVEVLAGQIVFRPKGLPKKRVGTFNSEETCKLFLHQWAIGVLENRDPSLGDVFPDGGPPPEDRPVEIKRHAPTWLRRTLAADRKGEG